VHAAALFLALAPAPAQDITGSIFGSVRDASGSTVSAAQLRLVHTATGAERRAATNDLGEFVLSGVNPGAYSLTISSAGFKTLERTGIALIASERLSLGTLVLEVGAVQERVTVTAQGATVQTVSAERSA